MKEYYEEDVLVQKVQSGEMNMLDYVRHHSSQWDEEYHQYCNDNFLEEEGEESAILFLAWKDKLLTEAMENGDL